MPPLRGVLLIHSPVALVGWWEEVTVDEIHQQLDRDHQVLLPEIALAVAVVPYLVSL